MYILRDVFLANVRVILLYCLSLIHHRHNLTLIYLLCIRSSIYLFIYSSICVCYAQGDQE